MVLAERSEAHDQVDLVSSVRAHHLDARALAPPGKATVLETSAVLLVVYVYGASQLEASFELECFTPSGARRSLLRSGAGLPDLRKHWRGSYPPLQSKRP
jgi:hypothetical protein